MTTFINDKSFKYNLLITVYKKYFSEICKIILTYLPIINEQKHFLIFFLF